MSKQIETIRKARTAVLNLIQDLSTEELNEIPAGFNNNIIWNVAHLTAAQQGVCYLRAGEKIAIAEKYFLPFKPETKPEAFVNAAEIETIKELLLTSLNLLENDYNRNLFANYIPWTTRYGVNINSIDEALAFLPFHEGLHLGYIMAQKRMIKNSVKV